MNRVICGVTVVLLILVFAAPSPAQPALDKRVSLDLKAMAPRDAFKVIASAIGYTTEVASDLSTPVDIVIGNISARTALNTICESIGCTWRVSGTVIYVEKAVDRMIMRRNIPAPGSRAEARSTGVAEMRRLMDQTLPAEMKFDRAPLAEVAARLSKATGFEITLEGTRPGQTFSGDLGGRPFSAALKILSEQSEGSVATIRIAGRKGALKIQMGAVRKPRK